jgi:hypothetical protein
MDAGQEGFFKGLFSLWTLPDSPKSSTCRPIQPEEIMALLGMSYEQQQRLLAVKWETAARCLRSASGKEEGLTILFDSMLHMENTADNEALLPNTGLGMAHCQQTLVTLNEATTYPLPTTKEWQVATIADHDLAILLEVAAQSTPLDKSRLTEKGYYNEWTSR